MAWILLPSALLAAGTNWMSAVDGTLRLSQFTIPGTHDAGALHEPFPGTAKCQDLTIPEQLNAGVRFLDIRCRHLANSFRIYHGSVDQELSFEDVLNSVIDFLDRHPTECVILSIKEEYTAAKNTRPFETTFDAYVAKHPSRWLMAAEIPTLNQARGKMILFRRFGARSLPKGIDASNWPDDTTFTSGLLRVQDHYNVSDYEAKWADITNLLSEAQNGRPDRLYVNFFSGNQKIAFVPNIPGVANAINPRLEGFFATHAAGHYGVVIMDFADTRKSALVYGVTNPTPATAF